MTDAADLQFERAEYDGGPAQAACAICASPLHASYFDVNGQTVCERCCFQLKESEGGGSSAGRVTRAVAAGLGTALAGSALYWAILAMTGYEFALIAIVVGFGVGKAVRWGSRGRGGWKYQTIAVVLTYLAIVGAYVPLIVAEIMKQPAEQADAAGDAQAGATADAAADAAAPADDTGTAPGAGSMLLAFATLLAFAAAAPFLGGVENIIGIVIIGVGLYEAWKLNRHEPLVITGPHALAPARSMAAAQ